MALIDTALVEVHKNLKCVNIFLTLSDLSFSSLPSTPANEERPLKIIVKSSGVFLKRTNKLRNKIEFRDCIKVEPKSLTVLHTDEKSACFRVNLLDDITNGTSSALYSNGSTTERFEAFKLNYEIKTRLIPNQLYDIVCSNCENSLLEERRSFKRVLELPTGPIDTSDWFCHGKIDLKRTLLPSSEDLFYGLYNIVLNINLLRQFKKSNCHYHCDKCLQYFGQSTMNGEAIKIWSDCIRIIDSSNQINSIFLDENTNETNENDETNDIRTDKIILKILSRVLYDGGIGDSNLMAFEKIVIETIYPNRKRKCILMNITGKQISVHFNYKDPSARINANLDLNSCKAFKLLYTIIDDVNDADNHELLQTWRMDINVQFLTISYKIFIKLAKTLIRNSEMIPQPLRNCKDLYLGYLFY